MDGGLVGRCRDEFEARLAAQEAAAAAASGASAAATSAGGSGGATPGVAAVASPHTPSGGLPPISPVGGSRASPLGTAAMHAAGVAAVGGVHAHRAPAVRGSTSVTYTSDILPGHHRSGSGGGPAAGTEAAGGPQTPKQARAAHMAAFAMAMPFGAGDGDPE